MRVIGEDIKKNEFKKVYLIYGEETYLRKQYRDKLRQAIVGDDTMNYSYFEGKSADVNSIKEMSETLPFFADKRLIVVENSGCFKSANDALCEYISVIPDTTTIVFVEEEIDKRGKLFKRVKEQGYETEMGVQNTAVLEKWVLNILNDNNKKITKDTMDYFISAVGNDMTNLSGEIEKLVCYCLDKEVITTQDIHEICTEQITSKIFDMIDALGSKNQKKTLDIYYDLISTKEPPMRILFMLARQFNIMLQVEELTKLGMNQKDIASKAGLQPFIVGKTMKQNTNFKKGDIVNALRECIQTEADIKSGNMDEKIGVEMLLIKYSSVK